MNDATASTFDLYIDDGSLGRGYVVHRYIHYSLD